MAEQDKSDLLTTLNTRLGDSDNFAFTANEKNAALDEAFNDDYVATPVWDDSLTYSNGTYQYAIPTDDITVIQDIYIKPDNSTDEPEKIASDLWEVVGTNIHLKAGAKVIPDGNTLYLKGKKKYTTDDDIAETNLQEYILNLAQLQCLNMYGIKKAIKFIKNDTSMGEIIAMKRELERKVQQYRMRLPKSFEAA